jgi:hypothetical protein
VRPFQDQRASAPFRKTPKTAVKSHKIGGFSSVRIPGDFPRQIHVENRLGFQAILVPNDQKVVHKSRFELFTSILTYCKSTTCRDNIVNKPASNFF